MADGCRPSEFCHRESAAKKGLTAATSSSAARVPTVSLLSRARAGATPAQESLQGPDLAREPPPAKAPQTSAAPVLYLG